MTACRCLDPRVFGHARQCGCPHETVRPSGRCRWCAQRVVATSPSQNPLSRLERWPPR